MAKVCHEPIKIVVRSYYDLCAWALNNIPNVVIADLAGVCSFLFTGNYIELLLGLTIINTKNHKS